ncbi:LysR family transcriptional regulator [Pseudomonas benzenivorans]|uniref:LysR family transcriptional regulator n=1 Tax=Pseudomonas benzenivorans TaxID=556533 RepID=A0ABZ0PYD3_9PSED|nr:LysR family transcriptional regulator [Pseudomonas benzenivorans]WPC06222.1 LysR family transcriptional regulator [Pseudomonas benzenivorans]
MSDKFLEMETFVRVVEAGSVSAAAEQLVIAKSAVSKRLSDLEARLGVQLLARTTRSLSLTDSGRLFLEHVKEILSAVDIAESTATGARTLVQGKLRIASPLTFGLMHLTPAIREFIKQYPSVTVDIDFSDSQVDLVHGGYDLALRIADLGDSRLAARPLTKIRHAITASPDYFKYRAPPKTPRDLLDLDCLRYSGAKDSRWVYTDPAGKKGAVDPTPLITSNNGAFLRDLAIAGNGIVNQPIFISYQAIRSGELIVLLKDYTWREFTAYVVYPSTQYLPLRVRTFIDFLAEYFDRDNPYWELETSAVDDF